MTRFELIKSISLLAVAAGMVSWSSAAAAQTAAPAVEEDPSVTDGSPAEGDEIIVTARNRTERFIDVPVAVTTVSSEALEQTGANDLAEISTLVPNLIVSKVASGTGASISIRGVGTSYTDAGVEQTVSVNLDGFQGARGFITNVAFLDLAQVEVLKGPQALFFGKNSPGGVISLRSNDPGHDQFVSMRAGYEFVADEKYVEGVYSTPISDAVGVRFAVRYSDMKGYFYNRARPIANPFEPGSPLPGAADNRVPSAETLTGRFTLVWQPNDDFTANFKLLGATYEDAGLARQFQPVYCVNGATQPTSSNGPLRELDPFGDCEADNNLSSGDLPTQTTVGYPGTRDGRLYSELKSYVPTLNLTYNSGPYSLQSITGYTEQRLRSLGNHDQTVYARQVTFLTEDAELFSQEVRLNTDFDSPFNLSTGAYYETGNRSAISRTRGIATPPVDPVTGNSFSFERLAYFDTEAWSVFGQVRWDILDNLELAVGARYTREKKDTTVFNTYVASNQTASLLAPGVTLVNKFRDGNISPEVTLTWNATPDVTFYGAYKTGYKSGGASVPVSLTATSTSDSIGFGPESAKGGEIGAKGYLFGRRLLFTAGAYRYNYNDLQLSSGFLLPNGIYTAVVKNAANARSEGVEVEATYRFSPNLSVRASGGYNNARILSYPNAICYANQTAEQGCRPGRLQDRAGQPLSRAPEWTFLVKPHVEAPVSENLIVDASAGIRYSSSYETQDDGYPAARQEAFTTLDASIGIRDADDRWHVSLIGRNLTDEYYIVTTNARSAALTGDLVGTLGRPREVALEVGFQF